jgi:CAAX prenyl protease-like protein
MTEPESPSPSAPEATSSTAHDIQLALPYVLPMVGFLVLTAFEGLLPSQDGHPHPLWYPLGYTVKVALVTLLAWVCRSAWRDLKPWPGWTSQAVAIVLGLIVTALWVGLDGHYPALSFLGKRSAFDPEVLPRIRRIGFFAVRLYGLVLLVPLIEELFWRSFLIRWVIDPDFERVPIGRVTPLAVAVTAVGFGFEHPEWLPGILTGLIWAWLLWWSKSVSACVLSHLVANLALGIYVIATGDWRFW